MPFFYEEDEGHHYNRVVEMAKTGQLNPKYFRKPSLHFYIRLPIVAASFLWEVKKGRVTQLEEVRTRDPFGLAGYAFTSSNPSMVKANRLFSVSLILGCVALTYFLSLLLGISPLAALFGAGFVALAPGSIEYSHVIGVDVPMAFFCILSTYLAVLTHKKFSWLNFLICCLSAGFACSSKYNALPICLVPILLATMIRPFRFYALVCAVLVPALGFLLASPYILVELPLFLNQFASEVWHYRIAGHVGNEAEPGIPQLIHYATWFSLTGFGILPLLIALIGLGLALKQKSTRADNILLLTFPVCYFLLMVMQKVHFERNMLVLFAYLGVLLSFSYEYISKHFGYKILTALALVAAIHPLVLTGSASIKQRAHTESRLTLDTWLLEKQATAIAVAGQLQMPVWVMRRPGTQRIDGANFNPRELAEAGTDRIILPEYLSKHADILTYYHLETQFSGQSEKQRIVENPSIFIFKRNL